MWCPYVYKWRVNPHTYACIRRQYETQCIQVMRAHTHTCTHPHEYIQTYAWWRISMQFAAAAPTEPLRRVNLPSELFKPLQFSSDLQDLWIWKSADNTSPHITAKPVTVRRRGAGGAIFLPSWAWMSMAAGGRGRCRWLSGSRLQILLARQQPFSPKCPPDTQKKNLTWHSQKKYLCTYTLYIYTYI